jgi:hypothetical protein
MVVGAAVVGVEVSSLLPRQPASRPISMTATIAIMANFFMLITPFIENPKVVFPFAADLDWKIVRHAAGKNFLKSKITIAILKNLHYNGIDIYNT